MKRVILSLIIVILYSSAPNVLADEAQLTQIEMIKGPEALLKKRPKLPRILKRSGMCCSSFDVDQDGRTKNIEVKCTDNTYKDPTFVAIKRSTFKAESLNGSGVVYKNVKRAYPFRIKRRGKQTVVLDTKRILEKDGKPNFDSKRVCPLLLGDVPKMTRHIIK